MPTENRSSNTELQQIEAAGAAMTQIRTMLGREQRPDQVAAALEACDWSGTPIGNKAIILSAIRALRAPQHQGEPVAYLCKAEGAKWLQYGCKVGDPWKPGEVQVTPLYTHADPGEVERLKSTAEHFTGVSIKAAEEVSRLRAKLIELESSVREFLRIDGLSVDGSAARNKALKMLAATLSASAEPSAPHQKHCLLLDPEEPEAECSCNHRFMSLADDPRRCADCDAVEMIEPDSSAVELDERAAIKPDAWRVSINGNWEYFRSYEQALKELREWQSDYLPEELEEAKADGLCEPEPVYARAALERKPS